MSLIIRPKVYVAGPYTAPDPIYNTRRAVRIAGTLWDMGFCPFPPHLNVIWNFINPRPESFFLDWDKQWLLGCDTLLRLKGYSPGADDEERLSETNNIPIFHDLVELENWGNAWEGKECRTPKHSR